MKLVVPDLISPSYFPVVAAADLGFFRQEGLEVQVELLFPVNEAYRALRDGAVQFVGGSAHSALAAFPQFRGARLLAAQAQGMYWFLVMRTDLQLHRGEIAGVRGRTIGAAPWVEMGLRALLTAAGIDIERDRVRIIPVPGSQGAGVNFGVRAAQALEEGLIDGFWANGMGAEVAVRRGAGTLVLDVRRGDGPPGCFDYTFSSLACAERLLIESPDLAAAAVRALVRTQAALRAEPQLATAVGRKRFPAPEAELIAELIRRDAPYYDATIPPASIAGMSRFAQQLGLIERELAYADVVATRFASLWTSNRAG